MKNNYLREYFSVQLVSRHKSAKKKQPVSLTEDMLNELNKNHMGGLDNFGADDLYNMEDVWNEKPMKKVCRPQLKVISQTFF